MSRLASGEWDIRVSHTIEDLKRDWNSRPGAATAGAILHIGYERQPTRHYEAATTEFPGRLLLTAAARSALPATYKSSNSPVVAST
jgi:hypothetical protein